MYTPPPTAGPRIVAGNFDPGFFVEHFVKDLGIALHEARRMGLSLPGERVGAGPQSGALALPSLPRRCDGRGPPHTHAYPPLFPPLSSPGLALANQLYLAVMAQGHGRSGTQALYLALETLNGVKRAA